MKKTIGTLLMLAFACATAPDSIAQDGGTRDEPKSDYKAVYDAAVDFVVKAATEIAKQFPSSYAAGGVEHEDTWDKQTLMLTTLRTQVQEQVVILKPIMDDTDGKESLRQRALPAIEAIRAALRAHAQRASSIKSPRDASSGFATLYRERYLPIETLQTAFEGVSVRRTQR